MSRSICAILLLLALAHGAWAVPITVLSNNLGVQAEDAGVASMGAGDSSFGFPYNLTVSASAGLSSSETTGNWSGSAAPGGNAVLSFDFAQRFDNTGGPVGIPGFDLAQAFDNSVTFTADVDATYNLAGHYLLSGPSGARIFLQALLTGNTAGVLFNGFSDSRSTSNASLTLGAADGDFNNALAGSTSGGLVAGETYTLFFNAFIQSRDANGLNSLVAANAAGNITLTINEVAEPASFALLSLGLVAVRRRRRSVLR